MNSDRKGSERQLHLLVESTSIQLRANEDVLACCGSPILSQHIVNTGDCLILFGDVLYHKIMKQALLMKAHG